MGLTSQDGPATTTVLDFHVGMAQYALQQVNLVDCRSPANTRRVSLVTLCTIVFGPRENLLHTTRPV